MANWYGSISTRDNFNGSDKSDCLLGRSILHRDKRLVVFKRIGKGRLWVDQVGVEALLWGRKNMGGKDKAGKEVSRRGVAENVAKVEKEKWAPTRSRGGAAPERASGSRFFGVISEPGKDFQS